MGDKSLRDSVVPAYAGRYEVLSLLKLQFSKLSKNERARFLGLMERPKVSFRTEQRFDPAIPNREFRRRWHSANKGPFLASERKRFTVFTSRPGPGPLVKTEKALRKKRQADAIRHLRNERWKRDRNGPAAGPLPPYRDNPSAKRGERPPSTPTRSSGRTQWRRENAGNRILMMSHRTPDGRDYTGPVGGRRRIEDMVFTTPPPAGWRKYWYFYRTRGYWRISEHHPYGDEIPVITDWLERNGVT